MNYNSKHVKIALICSFLATLVMHLSIAIVKIEDIINETKVEKPGPIFRLLWDFKRSLNGYNTNTIVIFLALAMIFYYILEKQSKILPVAVVTSGVLTFFQVFGMAFKADNSWNPIFGGARAFVKAIVLTIGYGILYYYIIIALFILFENFSFVKKDVKVTSWFTNNKKSLFVVALLIMLMWLPYYASAFPGLTNYDFFDMLNTYYGKDTNSLRVVIPIDPSVTLNNNNPVIQTLWAVFVMKVGNKLGSPYIGLFIFILLQFIMFALVLSYVIKWLAAKNINKKLRIALLLIYGLVPIHNNFALTTLKDTNFSAAMVIYLLCIIDMALDIKAFTAKKFNLVKVCLSAIIMVFLRNNGFYVILLSAIILLIAYRKYYKKILIPFLVPILLYEVVTNAVYPALKISPGGEAEAYSIPLQQVARLVVEHEDALTEEDKDVIRCIINYDQIKERYKPEISDPIKSTFKVRHTKKEFSDFMALWAKYLVKYPDIYVQATMNNTYGYFFPEGANWLTYVEITPPGEPYGLVNIEKTKTFREESTQLAYLYRNIPVIGMLESIGFNTWLIIFSIAILVYNKKKKMIFMMLPTMLLILTAIAGPVNTMMRYAYPAVLTAPVYFMMTGYVIWAAKNKKEDLTEEKVLDENISDSASV
ncbi:DUF6020 family protein [Eubacterium sp.]|uniref:DUF6020 family protein n=1 Tax=Eubacterium sp. TaxID=142586 RepID=UPI0025CD73D3|nr:DUF6020 family protein [Eubacterium sp.]MCR5628391.1 DUF6020 family protein [Eubacterium sp.]